VMYRILHATHPRTRDKWCIYPTDDWAHGQSDSIEGVTHSICTLEFEDHRPLYDWYLDNLGVHHPRQIEFARLDLTRTVMSKRKLLKLVTEKYVDGWDDPRMPTLSGLRRRGVHPQAVRNLIDRVGVGKTNSTVEIELLEHIIRDDLEKRAPRAFAVLDPLKVVIENYPEGRVEEFEAPVYTQDPDNTETRVVPFSRTIYIEREDFMEDPPRKFFRLAPGQEVRLMNAYYITCTDVVKDERGEVVEVRATYDPESQGGMSPDGRRVKGTLHWVSAAHAVPAEVRLYDRLFATPNPEEGESYLDNLNPDSLVTLSGCMLEPELANARPGVTYQFMRKGFFCVDSKDSRPDALVFNRTIALRDTWAKIQQKS
jgi:glutaminyl-tRNA synthetase